MQIVAANAGSYPRTADAAGRPNLARTEGLGAAELDQVRQSVIRDVIAEQAKAGLDLVSDGQVRWADPVSPVMGRLANVTPGPRMRFLDTPLYFRVPVVGGPVSLRDTSFAADEVKWAVAVSGRPVAVTIPGPITLSRIPLLRAGSYRGPDALMDALVPLLADEVERLAAAGASSIVIEEPWLGREPGAAGRLGDAMEVIAARRGAAKLWVFPSSADAGPLWEALQALPVDGLVLDLTAGPGTAEAVASAGSRLGLLLGLVDVRTTKLETPGRLAKTAEVLLASVKAPLCGLAPSGGLEWLPRQVAFAKCRVLAKARDLMRGKRGRRPGKGARRRKRGR